MCLCDDVAGPYPETPTGRHRFKIVSACLHVFWMCTHKYTANPTSKNRMDLLYRALSPLLWRLYPVGGSIALFCTCIYPPLFSGQIFNEIEEEYGDIVDRRRQRWISIQHFLFEIFPFLVKVMVWVCTLDIFSQLRKFVLSPWTSTTKQPKSSLPDFVCDVTLFTSPMFTRAFLTYVTHLFWMSTNKRLTI